MNSKEKILKEKLTKVKSNDYVLESNTSYFELALEMMECIGSTDPELRDELIYHIFYLWITGERFSSTELKKLLCISLDDEHIFYELMKDDKDGVFKRTFSALVVALIIYQHGKENFLTEEELVETKNKLVKYMLSERDVRGYIEIKGWAHSAAHTADALDEIVQCGCFKKADIMDVLNSIRTKVCIGYYVYIDEESERMVTAVESALNRKILNSDEIIKWLDGFKFESQNDNYIEKFHAKVNIKGFLRSLYFRLLDKDDWKGITEEIRKILKEEGRL